MTETDAPLSLPAFPVRHYEAAKAMNVQDMTRGELMSEVVRLREQQSMMIDFCVDAEKDMRARHAK